MSRSVRHNFILIVVALSGCLAAFGGWRFAKASAPVNGPIVLISIDSLRADHLSPYGDTNARTPAIAALAADSVVFERAYAHVPQTLPSHASLLTGRLPFETGVRDVEGFSLPSNIRTIADLLQDRGYATGGIVSSFLLRKDTGINRGFAFFDDERPVSGTDVSASLTRDGMASEEVAEHWLDSIGTSRAFLFLHIAEPHPPHVAPTRLAALDGYDAEVAYADEVVARLLAFLKSHQLYDRSTILLVSDHGEGLGEHGEQGHGLLAYEPALHVPLIIKQPAGAEAGRRVQVPVQLIDVVPTILDFAKAPGASGLRGRSLTPLLADGSIADTPIYVESMFGQLRFGWTPFTSVISGQYQLVSGAAVDELYDLSEPAADRTDVAAAHPDVVAALRRQLADFTIHKAPFSPARVTPADRERFELLGYVGIPQAGRGAATETSSVDRAGFIEEYRTAVLAALNGDRRHALESYQALTRVESANTDLWMHVARTAATLERHDVALEAFAHVLALDPASTAAHLGVAVSNLRARRLDAADAEADIVLADAAAESVQKAEAHEVRARTALNRRAVERAREEAAAAEAADPGRPVRAFVDGRIALDQGRYSDAAEALQQALDSARQTGRAPLADLRVYAAEAMLKTDRRSDAEALLSAELNAFPANARARTLLQSLLRASGRSRDAAALAQH